MAGPGQVAGVASCAAALVLAGVVTVTAGPVAAHDEQRTSPTGSEPGGARMVRDLRPGGDGSDPSQTLAVGSTVYLRADDGEHGSELWRTDGTEAGTTLVADVRPGPEGSGPVVHAGADGLVWFSAVAGVGGRELWRTDGSAAGTFAVTEVPDGGTLGDVVATDDEVFFVVEVDEVQHLWASDGTVAGTRELASIDERDADVVASRELTAVGDRVFFVAGPRSTGAELWTSDGTPAGTRMVVDLDPRIGEGTGLTSSPQYLTPFGGALVWQAEGNLYRTDGTAAGTEMVVPQAPDRGAPRPWAVVGATLYFAAPVAYGGPLRLWRTDGTPGSARLVSDVEVADPFRVAPPPAVSFAAAVGDVLYFVGRDDEHGEELWRTDGTPDGTQLVADVNPLSLGGHPLGSDIAELTAVGGHVFFTADDGATDRELWRSDGTATGTGLVADIEPDAPAGPQPEGATWLTAAGDAVYVAADDREHGRELWRAPSDAAVLESPVVVRRPLVLGVPRPGSTLRVDPGAWSGPEPIFRYRWYIGGQLRRQETGSTYAVTIDDVDERIEVHVVASRPGEASRAASTPRTAPVGRLPEPEPDGHLQSTDPPRVSGRPRVGQTLMATDGTWSAAPDRLEHQWYVDGIPVPGATASRLVLPPGAVGHRFMVRVTARDLSGAAAVASSAPTSAVAPGRLRRTTPPVVRGPARVGALLRAAPGHTLPTSSEASYRWTRGGLVVPGAVGPRYRLTARDRGRIIAVRVTSTRAGYVPAVATARLTRRVTARR